MEHLAYAVLAALMLSITIPVAKTQENEESQYLLTSETTANEVRDIDSELPLEVGNNINKEDDVAQDPQNDALQDMASVAPEEPNDANTNNNVDNSETNFLNSEKQLFIDNETKEDETVDSINYNTSDNDPAGETDNKNNASIDEALLTVDNTDIQNTPVTENLMDGFAVNFLDSESNVAPDQQNDASQDMASIAQEEPDDTNTDNNKNNPEANFFNNNDPSNTILDNEKTAKQLFTDSDTKSFETVGLTDDVDSGGNDPVEDTDNHNNLSVDEALSNVDNTDLKNTLITTEDFMGGFAENFFDSDDKIDEPNNTALENTNLKEASIEDKSHVQGTDTKNLDDTPVGDTETEIIGDENSNIEEDINVEAQVEDTDTQKVPNDTSFTTDQIPSIPDVSNVMIDYNQSLVNNEPDDISVVRNTDLPTDATSLDNTALTVDEKITDENVSSDEVPADDSIQVEGTKNGDIAVTDIIGSISIYNKDTPPYLDSEIITENTVQNIDLTTNAIVTDSTTQIENSLLDILSVELAGPNDTAPYVDSDVPADNLPIDAINATGESIIDEDYTQSDEVDTDEIQCPYECECEDTVNSDSPVGIKVDCSGKSLTAIPSGIDERVNVLLLGNNELTEIPANFAADFPDLKKVCFKGNHIQKVEIGAFYGSTDLNFICLEDNQLTEVPEELLTLTYLETLNLRGNPIESTISASLFTKLSNIQKLILPENTATSLLQNICKEQSTLITVVIGNSEYQCSLLPSEVISKAVDVQVTEATVKETTTVLTENDSSATTKASTLPGPSLLEDLQKQNEAIVGASRDTLESISKNIDEKFGNAEEALDKTLDRASEATNRAVDKVLKETKETIDVVKEHTTDKLVAAIEAAVKAAEEAKINAQQAADESEGVIKEINSDLGIVAIANKGMLGFSMPTGTIEKSVQQADTDLPNLPTENVKLHPDTKDPESDTEKKSNDIKDGEKSEEEEKAEAAKANVGGGVDSLVIGLVVGGMILVVVGVTVKKNWRKIKRTFGGRQEAQTATPPTNGHGPHTPDEAEPLRQDKSPV